MERRRDGGRAEGRLERRREGEAKQKRAKADEMLFQWSRIIEQEASMEMAEDFSQLQLPENHAI